MQLNPYTGVAFLINLILEHMVLWGNNKRNLLVPFAVAEREGFEPSDPVTQVNGFRDRPIRPLWHLSPLFQNCLQK